MISPDLFAAYVTAVIILMLIPGPNVALIVANSLAHGVRYGLLTLAGTASAMVVQLGLTALGLAQVLGAMGSWFGAIRWIGVVYLFYLGIREWRAGPADLSKTAPQPKSPYAIALRGFVVSMTNPKTLFFYAAFFPQFLDKTHDMGMQILILSVTFVLIAGVVDSGWALLASRAKGLLARRPRLRNRLTGGFLMGAGLGLAAARVK